MTGQLQIGVTPPSEWDSTRLRGLIQVVREDMSVNGSLLTPGTQMLAHYRFGRWVDAPGRNAIARAVGDLLYRIAYPYVRNVIGFEVPRTANIGRRVRFVHQHGVTIHAFAQIGDGCLVRHNVTIGLRWVASHPGPFDPPPPRIGAGVQLGVGATIIGGVAIGDGAMIGAMTVVTRNVPAGASVVPTPSRILQLRDEADSV